MLISVDHSENAKRTVDYVARMVGNHPEIRVTLLHVVREPGADTVPEPSERATRRQQLETGGRMLLEGRRADLVSAGLSPDRVRTKLLFAVAPETPADVILREKHEGGYETIVVGRRGVSKKEEFMFGSVSSRLVREAGPQAVWVVA